MGTRAITLIVDQTWTKDNQSPLVNMYRQHDGYPSGHGAELFGFLVGLKLINGMSGGEALDTHANGAGCLAAQLVDHFKEDVGGIYLHDANKPIEALVNDGDDCGYVVFVDVDSQSIRVDYYSWGKLKFSGSLAEFGEFVNRPDADEE